MTTDDTVSLEPFEVVLLRPDEPLPRALDGTPVDLSDAHDLDEAEQQALADSTVHIHPAELGERALRVVNDLPVPRCFERSGWLQDHQVLVLDDAARTGPVRFELHETLGLRIEEDE
ncbi:hypothetical protein [Saccharopolyspora gregorii]|uniref:Cas3 C-terminal domain-containing protein n=1 Tax=Saccharopolyspora gregorii TaxID=33914 RepID=A0ABP6RS00_9PSEU